MGVQLSTTGKEYKMENPGEEIENTSPSRRMVIKIPEEYSREKFELLYKDFKLKRELTLKEREKAEGGSPAKNFMRVRENLSKSGRYVKERPKSRSESNSDISQPVEEDDRSSSSSAESEVRSRSTSRSVSSTENRDRDRRKKSQKDADPEELLSRRISEWALRTQMESESSPSTIRGTMRRVQSAEKGDRSAITSFKTSKSYGSYLNLISPTKLAHTTRLSSTSLAPHFHNVQIWEEEGEEDSEVVHRERGKGRGRVQSPPPKTNARSPQLPVHLYPVFVPIYLDNKSGLPLRSQEFEPFTFDLDGRKVKSEENIWEMLEYQSGSLGYSGDSGDLRYSQNSPSPMRQLRKLIEGGKVDTLMREKVSFSFDEREVKTPDVIEEEKTIRTETEGDSGLFREEQILKGKRIMKERKFTFGIQELDTEKSCTEKSYTEKSCTEKSTAHLVENVPEHISHFNQEVNWKMKKGYF